MNWSRDQDQIHNAFYLRQMSENYTLFWADARPIYSFYYLHLADSENPLSKLGADYLVNRREGEQLDALSVSQAGRRLTLNLGPTRKKVAGVLYAFIFLFALARSASPSGHFAIYVYLMMVGLLYFNANIWCDDHMVPLDA
jgi:hypothetical protein